jgi:hypothetical protein
MKEMLVQIGAGGNLIRTAKRTHVRLTGYWVLFYNFTLVSTFTILIVSLFFILFYHFCIYLHVYALFGSTPQHTLGKTCSALLFSNFVEEKT